MSNQQCIFSLYYFLYLKYLWNLNHQLLLQPLLLLQILLLLPPLLQSVELHTWLMGYPNPCKINEVEHEKIRKCNEKLTQEEKILKIYWCPWKLPDSQLWPYCPPWMHGRCWLIGSFRTYRFIFNFFLPSFSFALQSQILSCSNLHGLSPPATFIQQLLQPVAPLQLLTFVMKIKIKEIFKVKEREKIL